MLMIKKIITAAALVAASSALAGAASVTLDLTSTYFGSSSQTATYYSSLFNTYTQTADGFSNNSTYYGPAYNYLTKNQSAGTLYYKTANGGSQSANLPAITVSDGSVSLTVTTTSAQGANTAGYFNTLSTDTEFEGVTSFTLSFTAKVSYDAETTDDDGNTTEEKTYTGYFGLYYVDSSGNVTKVYSTALTSSSSAETTDYSIDILTVLGEDTVTELLGGTGSLVYAMTGTDTAWKAVTLSGVTLTATVTTTEVPEPSAFGLLAGVGALAFIASRRRRTRKA